ncbi:MAG: RsmG family class I SAM-dependent methyltransferase [Bdellovibrionota bacterium]|nr:RsmG family class I SAM-dependent methyltransferase [Bdellovibrionota bacterium]
MKNFSKEYLNILKNELKGINLTRILDQDEFYYKQILDSVLPIESSELILKELNKRKIILDIGFGGGFPLLPLGYKFPSFKCIGLESKNKKVEAVRRITKLLNLKNIDVFHKRIEDVLIDVEVVITFKAVGEVNKMLKSIRTNKSIYVCFYKGPNFFEKEGTEPLIKGWKLVEKREVSIPGTEGRLFLVYKNHNVPHGTQAKNKINLVKLSELL